ncbi:MAG: hypothetical protein O7A65_04700, partial [Proteobacteria bacterium]|nr:hypothetical protein [Pseudomonadota bacterium]
MKQCDAVQERLAKEGAGALAKDAALRRHVEGCTDCTRFLDALAQVDAALRELPSLDAPDRLVADTLEAVRQAEREPPRKEKPRVDLRIVAGALAACLVVAALVGLTQDGWLPSTERSMLDVAVFDDQTSAPLPEEEASFGDATRLDMSSRETLESSRADERDRLALDDPSVDAMSEFAEGSQERVYAENKAVDEMASRGVDLGAERSRQDLDDLRPAERNFANAPLVPEDAERDRRESEVIALLDDEFGLHERDGRLDDLGDMATERRLEEAGEDLLRGTVSKTQTEAFDDPAHDADKRDTVAVTGGAGGAVGQTDASLASDPAFELGNERQKKGADEAESEVRRLSTDEKNRALEGPETPEPIALKSKPDAGPEREGASSAAPSTAVPSFGFTAYDLGDHEYRRSNEPAPLDSESLRQHAQRYLDQVASLDGLSVQDATGYWANSYIPGDPEMRLLQARLRAWDRQVLGQDVRLERAAHAITQPFDAPEDAAVAVFLHADTRAVQGPTRLRVEVGLKGAEREGGHRPAMNVGVVVDLRTVAKDGSGPRLRALILALERLQQPGDRFSLTVAGPGGGLLVPPEEFRHGPLLVALYRMFGEGRNGATVELPDALNLAMEDVRRGDDPNAVLGSSLVLLVTRGSLAEELSVLEGMAHESAVTGVPWSVVSVGAGADLDHIDRLVAAGQGHRRILETAQEAESLVDRELSAASRAVARAVRLGIRLAPGVELVDVIGSRRLDAIHAARVREAEGA